MADGQDLPCPGHCFLREYWSWHNEGAKWAYESLTFGGYWAWDPVENASLVPWLIWRWRTHPGDLNATETPSGKLFLFHNWVILHTLFDLPPRRAVICRILLCTRLRPGMNGSYEFSPAVSRSIVDLFYNALLAYTLYWKEESSYSREFGCFLVPLYVSVGSIIILFTSYFGRE